MKMIVAIALAASVAAPAYAKDDHVFVTSAAVKDKPVIALAPAKAYVLVRAEGQTAFMLMKDPDAADQAAYDRLRAEAFAEEQERYAKRLKRYERDIATYAKAPAGSKGVKPVKPPELNDANFAFTPFPLMTQVAIGPMNRLSNAKGASVYLTELTPGSYRLYGPVMAGAQGGMAGLCFCMGSVRFTVKAGEVTDLGRAVSPEIVKAPPGDSAFPLLAAMGGYRIEPATATMPVDPRLQGATIRPAAYRPAGKLPNFFGVPIARLAPMPGVFAYDRDKIVDLTGSVAAEGR